MKRMSILTTLVFVVLFLSGCAQAGGGDYSYSFVGGFIHGLILPFAFIGSLFMDNVAIYAINNSGGWYDFGYVVGASAIFGAFSNSGRLRRRY